MIPARDPKQKHTQIPSSGTSTSSWPMQVLVLLLGIYVCIQINNHDN
jgi:hypothetical protein